MAKEDENTPKYIPFIKWVGGKRAIADRILELAGVNTKEPVTPLKVYIEPFLGGGAMFFHLKNIGLIGPNTKVFLSDMNKSLINTYKVIQHDCEKLIMELKEHEKNHGPDSSWPRKEKEKKLRDEIVKNKRKPKESDHAYYYYVRDYIYNDFHKKSELSEKQKIELAAAFIYLNRTGFNGMYRENADGEMNIPRGRYINPAIVNAVVLRSASEALQGVDIDDCPYQKSLTNLSPGALVYFDPPYFETFTDYNGGGFGESDQVDLAQLVSAHAFKSGADVIISNSSHSFTRELYEKHGFECGFINAARNINSDGQGRSKVKEIVAYINHESRRKK